MQERIYIIVSVVIINNLIRNKRIDYLPVSYQGFLRDESLERVWAEPIKSMQPDKNKGFHQKAL
jgi:hypothetical protein